MPTCKKCHNKFSGKIKINDKKVNLNSRNYCLDCSPWKSNKGRELRESNKNHKEQEKTCPLCDRNFPWNKNNVCSTCRNGIRRYINREKAIKTLGSKCRCGIDDPDILTFHHLDPKKKDFELCSCWHFAWETIEKELAKCQLLCYNCHMKLHCPERKKYTKLVELFRSSGEIGKHTGL